MYWKIIPSKALFPLKDKSNIGVRYRTCVEDRRGVHVISKLNYLIYYTALASCKSMCVTASNLNPFPFFSFSLFFLIQPFNVL